MSDISLGDVVKFKTGSTLYRVILIEGSRVEISHWITKTTYPVEGGLSKLYKVNRYSIGDVVSDSTKSYRIRSIQINPDETISYKIMRNGVTESVKENWILTQWKKEETNGNENRLQESKSVEPGGDDSGIGEQLCFRNRISYKCGYRGHEYCINQGPDRFKRIYDELPLGYQSVS